MPTRYTFTDDSNDVRLSGFLTPSPVGPGGGTVTGQVVFTDADINEASVQFKPGAGATVNGSDLFEWYDDAGNLLGYVAADGTIAAAMTGNFANFGFRLNRDAGKFNVQDKNGVSTVEVTGNGRLGFFGQTTAAQPIAIANASGGAIIDAEARTALNALLAAVRTLGLIAT